jgi:hypothetical protein
MIVQMLESKPSHVGTKRHASICRQVSESTLVRSLRRLVLRNADVARNEFLIRAKSPRHSPSGAGRKCGLRISERVTDKPECMVRRRFASRLESIYEMGSKAEVIHVDV